MVLRALGISGLVVALAAVPARATVAAGNLLVNGGAESGAAAPDSATIAPPFGWSSTGEFTQVAYGASGGFPDAAVAGSFGGGKAFFAGGNVAVSTAAQVVDVSSAAAQIDSARAAVNLSARLGGFETQEDHAEVFAVLRNVAGDTLTTLHLAPISAADRKSRTALLPRIASTTAPSGTRTIEVDIVSTRVEGSYNDGYADDVSLTLGGAHPQPGRTATAATVSGTVLVRRPGTTRFAPLGATGTIPVGSIVDARNGTVAITVAFEGGRTRAGEFKGGLFKFTEPREKVRGKRRLTAHLELRGGNFATCGLRAVGGVSRKRVVRYLQAKANGRFRVIGKNSSGIERGTAWTTSDRCDGTLTAVAKGTVEVTDFGRRRTVLVRAGRSYLARPRR